MADRYQKFTSGAVGGFTARRLGLPRPEPLRRFQPGEPALIGPVITAGRGRLGKELAAVLEAAGAETGPAASPGSLVFDATGITDSAGLAQMYGFFHERIRSLAPCGRVLVLGTAPAHTESAREAVAQKAIEGFVRSVGKELRRGATANLLQIAPDAADAIESAVRFLLSTRSAYVSGQVLAIGTLAAPASGPAEPAGAATDTPWSWDKPLLGRKAVVTGAARGIGAVIARTLARDGAFVLCVDVPGQSAALGEVAAAVRGEACALDITSAAAAAQLGERLNREEFGGVNLFVHNAGVTRDKTLGRMDRTQWDAVLDVNLRAVETLTAALLDPAGPLLRPGGRIVCTSSINGIAGAAGQTNYAASKAGLLGLVQALAPRVADQFGGTVNTVAPGFIETQMTAAVPLFVREAGRRMNSLRQGGQPVDVAEAVAFLAAPGSARINGQTLRVCGQSLLGA